MLDGQSDCPKEKALTFESKAMNKILITLCLAAATSAHAEFKDGNKLLYQITGEHTDKMIALGYITGVSDTQHGVLHCAPPNVTAGQILDMVKIHLQNSPSTRHMSADLHVTYVLKEAWPCPEKKSNGRNNT